MCNGGVENGKKNICISSIIQAVKIFLKLETLELNVKLTIIRQNILDIIQ